MLLERIAVIGAHGAVGRALLSEFAGQAEGFARSPGPGVSAVGDYHNLGVTQLAGFTSIVNCAGLVAGSPGQLFEANVAMPRHLCEIARQAGAQHFVQLSSFSALGDASVVGPATPERPRSEYGRSKLDGDRALLELADDRFAVCSVRLPAIVGTGQDKLTRLVRTWLRVRYFPAPRRPVRRSMISVRMAARALTLATTSRLSGVCFAADPEPFEFALAAEAISLAARRNVRLLPLPGAFFAPLAALAPAAFSSLYRDSMIQSAANIAGDFKSDLYSLIAAIGFRESDN